MKPNSDIYQLFNKFFENSHRREIWCRCQKKSLKICIFFRSKYQFPLVDNVGKLTKMGGSNDRGRGQSRASSTVEFMFPHHWVWSKLCETLQHSILFFELLNFQWNSTSGAIAPRRLVACTPLKLVFQTFNSLSYLIKNK